MIIRKLICTNSAGIIACASWLQLQIGTAHAHKIPSPYWFPIPELHSNIQLMFALHKSASRESERLGKERWRWTLLSE